MGSKAARADLIGNRSWRFAPFVQTLGLRSAAFRGRMDWIPASCTASSLFLATSPDGVDWKTYPSAVFQRGAVRQFSANVYRSTFAFEPDWNSLTLWLTGATTVQRGDRRKASVLRWSAAVWHTQRLALLEHVRLERQALKADSEPDFVRRLAVENALP